MLLTYIIICWGLSAFALTYWWEELEPPSDEAAVAIVVAAFMSPFLIALALAASPLALPIGLGYWLRKRKKRKIEAARQNLSH